MSTNLNEIECGCQGIYESDVNGCRPPEVGEDPCPQKKGGFFEGVNFFNVTDLALQISYGLGFLRPPQADLNNQMYQLELQRQKQQTNIILIGLGVLMLVIVILVLRKR